MPVSRTTASAGWARCRVRVIRHARCANGRLDPDQWFPVSAEADKARQEAAVAIAICTTCLVRDQCLALSLRHWDIGQHGVWVAWSQPNARHCGAGHTQAYPTKPSETSR
jgi:hypothetical protein